MRHAYRRKPEPPFVPPVPKPKPKPVPPQPNYGKELFDMLKDVQIKLDELIKSDKEVHKIIEPEPPKPPEPEPPKPPQE